MSFQAELLRAHVRRARALYAKHALGWSVVGGAAMVLSIATFWSATKLSGACGGVAFALPVGIWMAVRWRAMREDGPLMRLFREPEHIVWHYPRIESVRSRSGSEMKRNHQVCVGDDEGALSSFWVAEHEVSNVVKLLTALAPHATAGFTEERARAYREEPLTLRTELPVAPVLDEAGSGMPYREAGDRVDPAGAPEARRERRRARARRRIRNIAVAVVVPALAIGAWINGAQSEVRARAQRDVEREAWWKTRAQAVIDGEMIASSKVSAADVENFSRCRGRLAGHDWAAGAFRATRSDGSQETVRREGRGSKSMSGYGAPPMGAWGNTLGAALGTAPWRWLVAGANRQDPLFSARLLDGEHVLVRMVDRETGALLCQGSMDYGYATTPPRCAELEGWPDRRACLTAARNSYLTHLAVESGMRDAMWGE